MSWQVTGWLLGLEDKPEDPALRLILFVAAHSADNTGGNIRLAAETIAFRAGYPRTTVRRRLEAAVSDPAAPWSLEVVRPSDHRRPTTYRFLHYPELLATSVADVANESDSLATSGHLDGQTPTYGGHQMATPGTTLAAKGFKGSKGSGAAPPSTPQGGRVGAEETPSPAASPGAGEKVTDRAEAAKRFAAMAQQVQSDTKLKEEDA